MLIRAGIIGAGSAGTLHADALRRLGVRIVGVAAVSHEVAQSDAARLGVPVAYESVIPTRWGRAPAERRVARALAQRVIAAACAREHEAGGGCSGRFSAHSRPPKMPAIIAS